MPWGRAEIIYKFDNADDCTSNYAFGTGEFEVNFQMHIQCTFHSHHCPLVFGKADACITSAGDKDKNTIEYDSSEVNERFRCLNLVKFEYVRGI